MNEKKHFEKARSYGVFGGGLMEAVHVFKYGRKIALSRPLGGLVEMAFQAHWTPTAIDLIVPVPLHKRRLRERGFNQAHLLIAEWAEREGLRHDNRLLFRARWTEPQTAMNRESRQKNVRGAFQVRDPKKAVGKKILVVDDVYTTGATVNECARVLKKAGAERVDVLTLARTV